MSDAPACKAGRTSFGEDIEARRATRKPTFYSRTRYLRENQESRHQTVRQIRSRIKDLSPCRENHCSEGLRCSRQYQQPIRIRSFDKGRNEKAKKNPVRPDREQFGAYEKDLDDLVKRCENARKRVQLIQDYARVGFLVPDTQAIQEANPRCAKSLGPPNPSGDLAVTSELEQQNWGVSRRTMEEGANLIHRDEWA